MNATQPSRSSGTIYTARYLLYSSLGLLVASLVAYWPTLANPFLSDDLNFRVFFHGSQLDWAKIQRELWSGWGGLVGADYYRPLLTWSVVIDYLVWGTNPFGYHLTNVLLHTLNALLVAHIIVRLAGPGKRYPALLAALVFTFHPLHPEAVAWIAGRVDVLSAFFFLLTVRCYLAYRWTGHRRHLFFSLVALILGLGCKESVVVVPFVLLALDVGLKLARGTPRWAFGARPAALAHFSVIAVYLVLRKVVVGSLSGGQDLFAPYASLDAIIQTLKQAGIKLFLLIAPANPAALGHPWTTIFHAAVILMMILPFLELLTHGRRTIPGPLAGVALVLFPLALVAHIVVNPGDLTNSRVLYLPTAGLFILLYSAPWDPGVRHELRRLGAAQMAVLSLLLATTFFVILRINLRPWTEAGRMIRTIVAQTDHMDRETPPGRAIVIKGLPDVYQGAYVCRNGFLFSLVRPFHDRNIKRVYPVLDYFYGQDPGMLRAVHGELTRIVLWDNDRQTLVDLPPFQTGPHQITGEDVQKWSRLESSWWTPEPGLRRRVVPGGVELIADKEGASLLGPVMRIAPHELHALRLDQDGEAGWTLGWSTAEEPDAFPSGPAMEFAPYQGPRTISLINHATWYLPSASAVGRFRLSVRPTGVPVVLRNFALEPRLPPLPLAVNNEPLPTAPGQPLLLPLQLQQCPYTHFKVVILNPAAPLTKLLRRPADMATPLVVPARSLEHLHAVAWAIEGFEALLYVDAVEADGSYLTTQARSRPYRVRFPGTVNPAMLEPPSR